MFLRFKIRRGMAKSIAYGALSRTRGSAAVAWCSGTLLYLGEINDTQELAWPRSIEVLEDGAARPQTLSLFPEDRCEGLLPDASIVRLSRPRQWRVLVGADACGGSWNSIGSGRGGSA